MSFSYCGDELFIENRVKRLQNIFEVWYRSYKVRDLVSKCGEKEMEEERKTKDASETKLERYIFI